MALPNPSMSFSPFAILTAEEMNDLVENIESLANGTGISAGAVTSSKINLTYTTDANGWRVYDYGGYKDYVFQKSNNSSFAMPAGQLNLDNIPMPVGVTNFRTKNVQVTLSTSNAQVVLGGYIGGATPDFNTFSIYAYNIGSGLTLSYWHFYIRMTV